MEKNIDFILLNLLREYFDEFYNGIMEYNYPGVKQFNFPNDCCDNISKFIGLYIEREFPEASIKYVIYNSDENYIHHWLIVDDMHVDLTLDQFDGHKNISILFDKKHPLIKSELDSCVEIYNFSDYLSQYRFDFEGVFGRYITDFHDVYLVREKG